MLHVLRSSSVSTADHWTRMHVDALEGVRGVAPRWTGRHSEGRWFISVRGPATIAVLREGTAAQIKNTRTRRRFVLPVLDKYTQQALIPQILQPLPLWT